MSEYRSGSREKQRTEQRAKEGFKNKYGSSECKALKNKRIQERHSYYKNK